MKPKRKKPAAKIHDRQATAIPMNALVRPVYVDDPYEHGATIVAMQNMRDDPLGRLHCRGQIDTAQFNAGRKMQFYYEQSEVGNVKAMDTTKEPVDGGGFQEPMTDSQMKARRRVIELEAVLGKDGAAITRDFLAHRLFIAQIAQKRGVRSDDEVSVKYLGRRLRECLECLAKELHLA